MLFEPDSLSLIKQYDLNDQITPKGIAFHNSLQNLIIHSERKTIYSLYDQSQSSPYLRCSSPEKISILYLLSKSNLLLSGSILNSLIWKFISS